MKKKNIDANNPSAFDFLTSINDTKQYIMTDENEKLYVPYLINRFLSGTIDTLFYANEMNFFSFLDKRLQYDYYFHAIRKGYRRAKWLKRKDSDKLNIICKYFKYNITKAKEIESIITDKDIELMKSRLSLGGIEK